MTTSLDLAWLAGFLEGEGSFWAQSNPDARYASHLIPTISFTTTDGDIAEHAASLLGIRLRPPILRGTFKPCWQQALAGYRAAGMMMTLYPLLGVRRRSKIIEILSTWRLRPYRLNIKNRILREAWGVEIPYADPRRIGRVQSRAHRVSYGELTAAGAWANEKQRP